MRELAVPLCSDLHEKGRLRASPRDFARKHAQNGTPEATGTGLSAQTCTQRDAITSAPHKDKSRLPQHVNEPTSIKVVSASISPASSTTEDTCRNSRSWTPRKLVTVHPVCAAGVRQLTLYVSPTQLPVLTCAYQGGQWIGTAFRTEKAVFVCTARKIPLPCRSWYHAVRF
jgi:hypothetical protein